MLQTRLLVDARYLIQKLSGLKNVGAPTAMLELVVSEKSLKAPPPASPTPVPVVSAPSRFKGMLGRAESLRKATLPSTPAQPPVPDVIEKAVPLPSSPSPPAVASVVPTPPPQSATTQPTPTAGATEDSPTPPHLEHPLDPGTRPQSGAVNPELGGNTEDVNGTTTQNESPDQSQSSDRPQPLELQEPPITTADMPKSPPPPPTPAKEPVQEAENGNVTSQTEETN